MRKRKTRARGREKASSGVGLVLRATRFELVDEDGRLLAALAHFGGANRLGSGHGLELYDESGSIRLAVRLSGLGPSVMVSADGNVVLALGHDDVQPGLDGGGAYLQLMSGSGGAAILWKLGEDGAGAP